MQLAETPEQLLAMALHYEELASRCSFSDPYRAVAIREMEWLLNEAAGQEAEHATR